MLENEMIMVKQKEGISYLQFKKLLAYPEITHMYVLKNGDMSFNVTQKTQEKLKQLERNYEGVCKLEHMDYHQVVRATQTHSTNIACVKEKIQEGPELYLPEYDKTDGLLTDQKGIVLSTTNADCNLILLFDPKRHVIGNIHAGWRGTFQKIVLVAIEKMKAEYGSHPEDMIACMAPSIGQCCFEVQEDVAKPCKELFGNHKRFKEIMTEEKNGKYHINTVLINQLLMEEAGIQSENIITSGICSKCNCQEIHSRRAEGENYGVGTLLVSLQG